VHDTIASVIEGRTWDELYYSPPEASLLIFHLTNSRPSPIVVNLPTTLPLPITSLNESLLSVTTKSYILKSHADEGGEVKYFRNPVNWSRLRRFLGDEERGLVEGNDD